LLHTIYADWEKANELCKSYSITAANDESVRTSNTGSKSNIGCHSPTTSIQHNR